MPPTLFGVASTPAHDGTEVGTQLTITPPASMVAGQLVVVQQITKRGATPVWSVGVTGGQTWVDEGQVFVSTNRCIQIWSCVFNGTWGANPRFDVDSIGNNHSAAMAVFSPGAGLAWSGTGADSGTQNGAAPTTPFDFTLMGITTTGADRIVLSFAMTTDDNELTVQTAGWNHVIRVDNIGGTDSALAMAWKDMPTAGATGDVVWRQTLNGGDVWIGRLMSFAQTAAGGDETAVVSPGALTLAGQAVVGAVRAVLSLGGISLAGQAAGAVLSVPVAPGGLSLQGQAAALTIRATVTPGDLTLQGATVATSVAVRSVLLPGALTLQGQTVLGRVTAPVSAGAVTLTGQTLGTSVAIRSTLLPGAVTLTGQAMLLRVSAAVAPGALTLQGQVVNVLTEVRTTLLPGALSLQGQAVVLRVAAGVTAGSLSLQGQSLGASVVIRSTVTPGSLVLQGQAASLRILSTLAPGSIAFTGQEVGVVLIGVVGPEIQTRRGPKTGGVATGDLETISREGPRAGGVATGVLEVMGREGP